MGCEVVPPDGNEFTPPWAIADLRAVHMRQVAYELRKVRWQIVAVEVDVHSCQQLTLAAAPDKGRCFAPFFTGIGPIRQTSEADNERVRMILTATGAITCSRTCQHSGRRHTSTWTHSLQGASRRVEFGDRSNLFLCC